MLRIKEIDVIRGFSILGIFFVNMLDFHSPIMYIELEEWWQSPLDRWTVALIDVAAQASFYPLFAFLFGFSMVVFRERAIEKGLSFPHLFIRRMVALFVIGCIHAFFIWHGDILITYAAMGGLLLLFHQASSRMWLAASIICFIPYFVISLLLGFAVLSGEAETSAHYESLAMEALRNYRDGTISDIFWQRWRDWIYVNNSEGFLFIVMMLLAMGLFGGYVAQSRSLLSIATIKRTAIVSLWIGMPLKLLPYLFGKNVWTEYVQDVFGGPALSIFYAAVIWLVLQKKRWKIFDYFASVGRMSLTNYLFQSVLCTFLFYSYGFGLYGSVRPFYGAVGTVVIYVTQAIISEKWLKSFHMGPIEWMWRTATYGKRPLLRRSP